MRMQSSGAPAYLHVACGFFVGLSQYAPKRNMTRIVATSVALTLSCCISCTPRLVGLKVEIWSQATLPWSLELFIGLGKYATTEGNSNGFIHPTFDVLNTKEQAQQTGTQITKQYKTLLVSRGNLAIKNSTTSHQTFRAVDTLKSWLGLAQMSALEAPSSHPDFAHVSCFNMFQSHSKPCAPNQEVASLKNLGVAPV